MRSCSSVGRSSSPKAMFSRTVIQGKIAYSWNTKMRRRSGPFTRTPSISMLPSSALSKPPHMLSSVDFPQPEGPSMQRNSPDRTSKSMPASTSIQLPFAPGKRLRTFRIRILGSDTLREPPLELIEALELAERCIEHEPDDADHEHGAHDQVVAHPLVARVVDEIAEPVTHGDHLRRDDDEPRDADRDA